MSIRKIAPVLSASVTDGYHQDAVIVAPKAIPSVMTEPVGKLILGSGDRYRPFKTTDRGVLFALVASE